MPGDRYNRATQDPPVGRSVHAAGVREDPNVAVLGHRGSGKTSLVESLLFESGATTRLGTVVDGTTVTDHDEDEKRRSMSISATLAHR